MSSTFFVRRTRRIDAIKIESSSAANSIIKKAKYGFVTVTGSGGTTLKANPIANPEAFEAAVRSISKSASSNTANNAVPESRAQTLSSELSELEQLRAQGILSEDEFTKAKSKLLDK
jgi:hypothetical protein